MVEQIGSASGAKPAPKRGAVYPAHGGGTGSNPVCVLQAALRSSLMIYAGRLADATS